MNLILNESDVLIDENFILPKSLYLCMVRYIEDDGMARGSKEMQHMESSMMINEACAREEREEGAQQEKKIISKSEDSFQTG